MSHFSWAPSSPKEESIMNKWSPPLWYRLWIQVVNLKDVRLLFFPIHSVHCCSSLGDGRTALPCSLYGERRCKEMKQSAQACHWSLAHSRQYTQRLGSRVGHSPSLLQFLSTPSGFSHSFPCSESATLTAVLCLRIWGLTKRHESLIRRVVGSDLPYVGCSIWISWLFPKRESEFTFLSSFNLSGCTDIQKCKMTSCLSPPEQTHCKGLDWKSS